MADFLGFLVFVAAVGTFLYFKNEKFKDMVDTKVLKRDKKPVEASKPEVATPLPTKPVESTVEPVLKPQTPVSVPTPAPVTMSVSAPQAVYDSTPVANFLTEWNVEGLPARFKVNVAAHTIYQSHFVITKAHNGQARVVATPTVDDPAGQNSYYGMRVLGENGKIYDFGWNQLSPRMAIAEFTFGSKQVPWFPNLPVGEYVLEFISSNDSQIWLEYQYVK